jgi:hypothetical protein
MTTKKAKTEANKKDDGAGGKGDRFNGAISYITGTFRTVD